MISVILPTLNEAARLPGLLASLAAETEPHEVIVVDGGSRDGTTNLAREADARLIQTEPGRGLQLACGAAAARGDVLLFLHADSRFPAGGLTALRRALAEMPDCPGGNFRLLFDGDSPFSHWLTGFYAWIRARGLYYGDSAIFVRRAAYEAIGGMRPIALMEDYDFTRRLETLGQTCCIEEPPLVTSSRRFDGRSALGIVWGWLELHALYHLGLPPALLAKRYARQCRRAAARPRQLKGAHG